MCERAEIKKAQVSFHSKSRVSDEDFKGVVPGRKVNIRGRWEAEQKEEIKETEIRKDSEQYDSPARQGGKIEDGGYH